MTGAFAATMIERSTGALAAMTANRLIEQHPDRFPDDAFNAWKGQIEHRLLELGAALAADEPELFALSVDWARGTFNARDVPEDDLKDSLVSLREVLTQELPEMAGRPAAEYLDRAIERFASTAPPAGTAPDPGTPAGKLTLGYLLAVLEGDRRRAARVVLDAVESGDLSVEQAYIDVLVPAQREVGRLWHGNELSITEEHFVTTTTRHVMSLLAARATRRDDIGKTVITAALSGDVHDIGLRVVGDFFEADGWKVVDLGADLPVDQTVRAAEHFKADLVVLSATLPTHLKGLRQAIEALHAASPVKVLVGGVAFAGKPEVWKTIGADGFAATLPEAVRVGRELVGL